MATNSHVQALGEDLVQGLEALSHDGTEIVYDVNGRGEVMGSRPQALDRIREILKESGQVYLYDGNVVLEKPSETDGKRLVPLMYADKLLPTAPSHLSALFFCAIEGKDNTITYQPPGKIISEVLNHPTTRDLLLRITCYRRLPVFNQSFELCGPGYHSDSKILVHGDNIVPIPFPPILADKAINRLPPGLRAWLEDFCFNSDADLVNFLGGVMSGVLINHLVVPGKPCFVFTGNQRNIGKTLLAATTGIILDGETPPLIHHSEDEDEFGKRLGAKIKPGTPFSVLLFDNRKESIGGGLLESLALASRVSVRRLGHNEDISRVNDFIWIFTANNARATTDMTSRSVIVHMHYEGDPRVRFKGTTKEEEALKNFARQHRQQILGELFGMVIRWREAGMPLGTRLHRCKRWAELIGGILQVAGLPEFLANQEESVVEIDEDLQELITLAEYVIANGQPDIVSTGGAIDKNVFGRRSADWVKLFREAKVCATAIQSASNERLQATAVGTFFSGRLNRSVPVTVGTKTGKAVLCAQTGRGRQRRYWLEVAWDEPTPTPQVDIPASGIEPAPSSNALPPGAVGPAPAEGVVPCVSANSDLVPTPDGGNGVDWQE